MSSRFRLSAPRIGEWQIQRQVAQVLAIELAPAGKVSDAGVIWWSCDHANHAGHPGARVGRGLIAGIPDLQVIFQGRAYFIELKAADGRTSKRQDELAAGILDAGAHIALARSYREVLSALDIWCIPRARRVREAA
jgi:hypothetical protein